MRLFSDVQSEAWRGVLQCSGFNLVDGSKVVSSYSHMFEHDQTHDLE